VILAPSKAIETGTLSLVDAFSHPGTVASMMMFSEKIAPHGPLPVSESEPPDALRLERTIESLEQENRWLKQLLDRFSMLNVIKNDRQ
jgi:hypothetical protein